MSATPRARILARIRAANEGRSAVAHPGDFEGWRQETPPSDVEAFVERFEGVGGEVARVSDRASAREWLADFALGFASVTVGTGVGAELHPALPVAEASQASLGISAARAAIAETGSLILDARDGRRTQLLAPTHVVLLEEERIYRTVREALVDMMDDLPAALGLHSGPSKSADIGQVMVKGVHGPGRIVAVLIERGVDA